MTYLLSPLCDEINFLLQYVGSVTEHRISIWTISKSRYAPIAEGSLIIPPSLKSDVKLCSMSDWTYHDILSFKR